MRIYKLELRFFTLESSSVAPYLFGAEKLNWFIGVSHRAKSKSHYNILTYLYLQVNKLFILKLEQVKNKSYWILYCKTGTNFCIWGQLLKSSYIRTYIIYIRVYIYIYNLNPGALPRKLVNFLSELMYFYWKICYFGHFLYTAPGQPGGGGQDFIRGAGPPWPHAGYGPIINIFKLLKIPISRLQTSSSKFWLGVAIVTDI